MSTDFVHLHNHSEYSLLDGACRFSDMIQWAVENSAPAVGLKDHGNMFGAWEFYTQAQDAGIQPIIGCEVYVAIDRINRRKDQSEPYHLTLIAENVTGYRNLLKIVSLGYIDGLRDNKPRINMEILREYREGIIALTGCVHGQVPHLLAADRQEEAVQHFKTLIDVMTPRYLYVEIQNHFTDKELRAYPIMIDLAREFKIPLSRQTIAIISKKPTIEFGKCYVVSKRRQLLTTPIGNDLTIITISKVLTRCGKHSRITRLKLSPTRLKSQIGVILSLITVKM